MKTVRNVRKWGALALAFGLAAPIAQGRGFFNHYATPIWIRMVLVHGDHAEIMVEQVPPAKAAQGSQERESKESADHVVSMDTAPAGSPELESKEPAGLAATVEPAPSGRLVPQPVVTFLTLTREDSKAGGARFMVPPGGSLWIRGGTGAEEPGGLEFLVSRQSAPEDVKETRFETAVSLQREAETALALADPEAGEVSPAARLLGSAEAPEDSLAIDVSGRNQEAAPRRDGGSPSRPSGPGGLAGIAVAYNTFCCCAVL